jgi:hypothetical protein
MQNGFEILSRDAEVLSVHPTKGPHLAQKKYYLGLF